MTVELIIMIFNQNDSNKDAWRALDKTKVLGLKNVILVERDEVGRAYIQQSKHYPARDQVLDDSFLLHFSNAAFLGDAKSLKRELMIAEFGECFFEEIEKAWQPHSAALLIFIPSNSLVNTQRLIDCLSENSGTLVHTTFPERTIKSIHELFDIAESQM